MSTITRRDVLTGAAAIAATAAVAAPAIADEAKPWMPAAWDIETDVVVLGTGSVISAALKAHDLGLKVIVLEKHESHFGGTTCYSGGAIFCPNSEQALAAGKPEISRETLLDYMRLCAKGQYREEILEALVDNNSALADYLQDDCGYQFSYLTTETPYYAWYTSYEGEPTPGTSCTLWSVPVNGLTNGRALVEYGKMACADRGIEIMYGTRGIKLIYSGEPNLGNGEVIGLIAVDQATGKELTIKARYGVVLGTGGFDHNREMVQNYLPGPVYSSIALNTCTGDGQIMAMEIGAEMRNMNVPFRYPFIMTQGTDVYEGISVELDTGAYSSEQISKMTSSMFGKPGSMMVNKLGQRFTDEASPYAALGRGFEHWNSGYDAFMNVPAYWICDSVSRNYYGLPGVSKQIFEDDNTVDLSDDLPHWLKKYDTLEELAADKGIDLENLLQTVERMNGFAATGIDKDFCRGNATFDQWTYGDLERQAAGELVNPCLAPIATPPFYCTEYYPGILQTAGGISTNGKAQALDVRGNVIPRLYAAGCVMAMPLGQGYGWAGGTITPGYVFGYIAAEDLADLQPWE